MIERLIIGWAALRGIVRATTHPIALRDTEGNMLSLAYGDGVRDDTRNLQTAMDKTVLTWRAKAQSEGER